MQINEFIKQLEKEYLAVKPKQNIDQNWLELHTKLQDHPVHFYQRSRVWLYAFLVLLLVGLSSGAIVLAQSAKPGEPMYALKQLAAPIVTAISKKSDNQATPQPTGIREEIKSAIATPQVEIQNENENGDEQNIEKENIKDEEEKRDDKKDEKEYKERNNEQYNFESESDKKEDSDQDSRKSDHKRSDKKWYEWLKEQIYRESDDNSEKN